MPQKKLLGGAYSPQGDLANLRHSRTNERIGHISRPNPWNSNSTHISPKVISTTVCAICSFRLSSIATHDSSSQCTCPSSWTSTSSSPSCPALSPATARPALVSYHALHILHHSAHWRSTFVLVGLKCTDHRRNQDNPRLFQ